MFTTTIMALLTATLALAAPISVIKRDDNRQLVVKPSCVTMNQFQISYVPPVPLASHCFCFIGTSIYDDSLLVIGSPRCVLITTHRTTSMERFSSASSSKPAITAGAITIVCYPAPLNPPISSWNRKLTVFFGVSS